MTPRISDTCAECGKVIVVDKTFIPLVGVCPECAAKTPTPAAKRKLKRAIEHALPKEGPKP